MKGTIDPVEAYFTSVTGLFGRTIGLFSTCWVAFILGLLAAILSWTPGTDMSLDGDMARHLMLVPVWWMVSLVGATPEWWGIVYLLYLASTIFAVCILETNLFRSLCLLFVAQAFHSWRFGIGLNDGDLESYFGGPAWHPFFWLLLGVTGWLTWLLVRSWRQGRS